MAKNWLGLDNENTFKNNDIKFLNIEWIRYSLTKFEDNFELHASVFFRPQYVWLLVYLYVGQLPNSSGQLVEPIVYIIPLE